METIIPARKLQINMLSGYGPDRIFYAFASSDMIYQCSAKDGSFVPLVVNPFPSICSAQVDPQTGIMFIQSGHCNGFHVYYPGEKELAQRNGDAYLTPEGDLYIFHKKGRRRHCPENKDGRIARVAYRDRVTAWRELETWNEKDFLAKYNYTLPKFNRYNVQSVSSDFLLTVELSEPYTYWLSGKSLPMTMLLHKDARVSRVLECRLTKTFLECGGVRILFACMVGGACRLSQWSCTSDKIYTELTTLHPRISTACMYMLTDANGATDLACVTDWNFELWPFMPRHSSDVPSPRFIAYLHKQTAETLRPERKLLDMNTGEDEWKQRQAQLLQIYDTMIEILEGSASPFLIGGETEKYPSCRRAAVTLSRYLTEAHFRPGGLGYQNAKAHFESLSKIQTPRSHIATFTNS